MILRMSTKKINFSIGATPGYLLGHTITSFYFQYTVTKRRALSNKVLKFIKRNKISL